MAGGDSSSSSMAGEGRSRRADARQRKKQKQEEEQQQQQAEVKNPLDPRFSDYDPKQGKHVFTRFRHRNLDLEAESTFGAMHNTDRIFREGLVLCNLANVVSVKIVSSDYGYPFNVYGTVRGTHTL